MVHYNHLVHLFVFYQGKLQCLQTLINIFVSQKMKFLLQRMPNMLLVVQTSKLSELITQVGNYNFGSVLYTKYAQNLSGLHYIFFKHFKK